jgi:hypothetical protein
MTESTASYTVGRGRPPLHTRFKKGQSGNPSGKPGPAKLAKQRFQRALYAALGGSEAELEHSKADNVIGAIARQMARDAAAGRVAATRLLLSLLDKESAADVEEDAAEQLFTGADVFSLLQGKMQGSEKQWLEEILWPEPGKKPARADGAVGKERAVEPAPACSPRERNEAKPLSLVQGKTQGKPRYYGANATSGPARGL